MRDPFYFVLGVITGLLFLINWQLYHHLYLIDEKLRGILAIMEALN